MTPALVASALGRPDVVVLDPAREGAGTAVMRALAAHGADRAHGRSTSRATRRRSAATSASCSTRAGASRSLRAFDIFPMTEHVELVAALEPPTLTAAPRSR